MQECSGRILWRAEAVLTLSAGQERGGLSCRFPWCPSLTEILCIKERRHG